MLLLVAAAFAMRFYRLGEWPPGPYRDEAYNGLDALGVLHGEHTLFFPANNGREPAYIYLVALSLALFGPSTFALRLPAALIGALATVPAWLLGRAWFGRVAGMFAACLWAFTLWPVHLGRIGLRAGSLAPLLALAFWLGTRAYRERRAALWFIAGVVYGLSFYTYLAARFTPLLLGLFAVYLIATGRRARLWDGGRVLRFGLGAALAVAPLALVLAGDPLLIFGRAGQVSILSPDVSGGDPLGMLLGNTGRALGMYLWRGDAILRHNALLAYDAVLKSDNPAGRPVFDLLMAGPFLAGLLWCLRHWRRPAAAFLLLWQLVMLGPTILAEDAPHFLRAAGVLPGAVFFPAIGLALLWDWTRLPQPARRAAVLLLLAGSAVLTMRDYAVYAQQPDVGYLFEAAAADLATAAAADADAGAAVYIDQRFPDGWPSIRFLLSSRSPTLFLPAEGLPPPSVPAAVYAWPYEPLRGLAESLTPPVLVEIAPGPPARGDLEPVPYSLYTRYTLLPIDAVGTGRPADFDGRFTLRGASAEPAVPDALNVALQWLPGDTFSAAEGSPILFIHAVGPEGIIGQYDGPIAHGLWPGNNWRPGVAVGERHTLQLNRPYDPATDSVRIGLYWVDTGERLPTLDAGGRPVGDQVIIRPASER